MSAIRHPCLIMGQCPSNFEGRNKRQHHQMHEHGSQMLVAVTEIMFEVIALVFEGVEGFVFDFPACATSSRQFHKIGFVDGNIYYPTEMADFPFG